MMKLSKKVVKRLILSCALVSALGLYTYTTVIPSVIKNEKVLSYIENKLDKEMGLDVTIQKPELKTGLNTEIGFTVDLIDLKKGEEQLLLVENFRTRFSLAEVFKKKVVFKTLGAKKVFADVNKLMALIPAQEQQTKTEQKNDWEIDTFDALLYLGESHIIYNITPETKIELQANKLGLNNRNKKERFVHFNFNADITKGNEKVNIRFADENKIIIGNKKLLVKDCPLFINDSALFFNAEASRSTGYFLEVYAKKFKIEDILELLDTNIVENNVSEMLAILDKIKGTFDLNIRMTKSGITGDIKLNELSSKLLLLNNLPFTLNSGDIEIKGNDLILKGFKGFYANKKVNDFEFEGKVEDYLKTAKTSIKALATVTNDLMQNYVSQVAGMQLNLTDNCKTAVLVDTNNADIDVKVTGKIDSGKDLLVNKASFSPVDYDRAYLADMSMRGDKLTINKLNYYIAKQLTKANKGMEPILTFNGNVRMSDGFLYDFGFDIPHPLPSEFLNVLIGQKLLKGGSFFGNLEYDNNGKFPILNGNLQAQNIRIPTQRMSLKSGTIVTVDDVVRINAEGRFRRANYTFSGDILNNLLFPIIVKDTNLTLDYIDVEKLLLSMNAQTDSIQVIEEELLEEEEILEEELQTFDIRNIIVENCVVKILKGKYKVIDFANLEADMSLDKNGIFKLKSNRFDIAEGISSVDVNCDLVKFLYKIKLGIKDVDANAISTALLNLSKEITGKASGIIDLNMDESLKLNGEMKFIIKDGTIQKVGLVEYALKFASLFRNPIAMISPSIITDLVNIPEGNFDTIKGEMYLKDNKVELMKIKSSAPQLSAYIVGCYNIENSDSILRIYTKFSNKNKGFAGFLRNISLNSLANRIQTKSRNDENYYASELAQLPPIDADEKDCQIFVTKVDGDVEHFNFLSSLKKIK